MSCFCGIEDCRFGEECHKKYGHYDTSIYCTKKFQNEGNFRVMNTQKIIFSPSNSNLELNEIFHIFMAGIRAINVDLSYGSKVHHMELIKNINEAIQKFDKVYEFNEQITKICTINGRTNRTGRMRNDICWRLKAGELIVLTCDEAYKNCSNNLVCYVSNFKRFLPLIQICDDILSDDFELRVVKIVGQYVTCIVKKLGILYSYQKLNLPQFDEIYHEILDVEIEDCEFAIENNFDMIIVPDVRHAKYYHQLRKIIKGYNIKLIAKIEKDLDENVVEKIIQHFHGTFVTFDLKFDSILNASRKYQRILIGKYPKEKCLSSSSIKVCEHVDGFLLKCDGLSEIFIAQKKLENISKNIFNYENCHEDIKNQEYQTKVKAIVCITNSGKTIKDINFKDFHFAIALVRDKMFSKILNLRKSVIPMVYVQCGEKNIETQTIEIMKIALKYGKHNRIIVSEDPVIERVNKI